MIRIIIEIEGKETSAPASQLSGGAEAPSPELFARGASLEAIDAGGAPTGIENPVSAFGGGLAAIDAGAAPEQAAPNEPAEEPKARTKRK